MKGAGAAVHMAHVTAKVALKLAVTGLDPSACTRGGCSLLPKPGPGSVWGALWCKGFGLTPWRWLCVMGMGSGDALPRRGKKHHQYPAQARRAWRNSRRDPTSPPWAGKELMAPEGGGCSNPLNCILSPLPGASGSPSVPGSGDLLVPRSTAARLHRRLLGRPG